MLYVLVGGTADVNGNTTGGDRFPVPREVEEQGGAAVDAFIDNQKARMQIEAAPAEGE